MTTRSRIALDSLLAAAGWEDAPLDRLSIAEHPPLLATPWPIAPMASAALAAVGLAVSRIASLRGGHGPRVHVDSRSAELAMASSSHLLVDGRPAKFRDPFTGFYRTRGGDWAYLHGNFPHLRDGLLAMLGVQNEPGAIAAAMRERDAGEVESDSIARGLCAARVRSRADWLAGPQAAALGAQPLIRFEKLADAPPRVWQAAGAHPLSGLRVLDLTRVIAGPMGGRALAEHGATVMRIAGPGLPSITSLVIDTGFGKLSAMLDLNDPAGCETLARLLRAGDVFIDGYRPGALAARGLGPEALTALNPALVSVKLTAFGTGTAWQGRRGYDSLIQATLGMTAPGPDGQPMLLPCQPIDYLSGYLIAFATMVALIRQAREGGRWHAALSLTATAEWMWRMRAAQGDETDPPATSPKPGEAAALSDNHRTAFGTVQALRPALLLDGAPAGWARLPVPLGSDPAEWP